MSLIVNVDTYITLQEMNTYIASYYLSTDPLRIQWEEMSDSDKEVYLRKSFRQLNALPFTGRPKDAKQPLPFPRYGVWTEQDWTDVKYAQAEQSLAISDTVAAQEVEDRLRLRRAGVKSYRIGDLQETFRDGVPTESSANYFGLCEAAYAYLHKWLRGGYRICTAIKPHYGIRWYLV